MKSTYLYLIEEEGDGYLKIGVATDVSARISTLQTGNVRRLKELCSVGPLSRKTAFALESKVHKALSDLRVVGEWFEPSARLGFIQEASAL